MTARSRQAASKPARARRSAMQPHLNLWLEVGGEVALSTWRVELLEAIDRLGSISAAAEEMDVPYRRAWQRVKEMERRLGVSLLQTSIGGQRGGGARLTPAAQRYVEQFHEFGDGIEEDVAARFQSVFDG
jgi:molybdate transport system regulatory protein